MGGGSRVFLRTVGPFSGLKHAGCAESSILIDDRRGGRPRVDRIMAEFGPGYAGEIDAQPGAQPDGPALGFNFASVGAARRLA